MCYVLLGTKDLGTTSIWVGINTEISLAVELTYLFLKRRMKLAKSTIRKKKHGNI